MEIGSVVDVFSACAPTDQNQGQWKQLILKNSSGAVLRLQKSNVFIFKIAQRYSRGRINVLHPHVIIFTNQNTFHSKLDSDGLVPFSVNKT